MTDADRKAVADALRTLQEKLGVWSMDTCNHRYQETNAHTGRTFCLECDTTIALQGVS